MAHGWRFSCVYLNHSRALMKMHIKPDIDQSHGSIPAEVFHEPLH